MNLLAFSRFINKIVCSETFCVKFLFNFSCAHDKFAHVPSSLRLKDQPVSERPRERLVERGADALSHAELIAILLRTGLKGANAVEIGRQLLQKFGTLQSLARASVEDLRSVKGIGRDKAVTLMAAFALARKMAEELQRESPVLDNPENVVRLLREKNLMKSVETLQVLLLNTRRRLIRVTEITDGTLDTLSGASARGVQGGHRRQCRRRGAGAQSSQRRSRRRARRTSR